MGGKGWSRYLDGASDQEQEHADCGGGDGDSRPFCVSCVFGVLVFEFMVIVVEVRAGFWAKAYLDVYVAGDGCQKETCCNNVNNCLHRFTDEL